jgi:DNA topoisomerase-1
VKQLNHNGILVPKYEPQGFKILMSGREITLSSEQEEMAVAWVKKLGTDYVKDKVFLKNFFRDFIQALNIKEKVAPEDFHFSEIQKYIEDEKNRRLCFPKKKKQLAQTRKEQREKNQLEILGQALRKVILNGLKDAY